MKVFISYSWKDLKIADKIDKDFQNFGIGLFRDVRELGYKGEIKNFMNTVQEADYVLLIVSHNYLISKNCMYEAIQVMSQVDYNKRILPIFVDGLKIFKATDRLKYISHWDEEIKELNNNIKTSVDLTIDIRSITNELKEYVLIREQIDSFMNYLQGINCFSFTDILKENYGSIFEILSSGDKEIYQDLNRILDIENTEEQEIEAEKYYMKNVQHLLALSLKGKIAYKNGKYEKAYFYYKKVTEKYPHYSDAHFELGQVCHFHKMDFKQAIAHYEKALENNSQNFYIYNNLAQLYEIEFQNYSEAQKIYLRALECNPTSAATFNNYGSLLETRFNDTDFAHQNFKIATTLDPTYARAWVNLGGTYSSKERKKYDKAVECYEKAIDNDPGLGEAYANLGKLLIYDLDKIDQGIEKYKKALEVDPTLYGVYNSLAMTLVEKKNDYAQAKSYLLQALDYNSNDPNIYAGLAVISRFMGDEEGANKYMNLASSVALENSTDKTESYRGRRTVKGDRGSIYVIGR